MKRIAVVSLFIVAIAYASTWFVWRSEIERLMSADSVKVETGLSLPSGARIKAAQSHLFSLSDGDNYDWLVESETSLLPWASENMSRELGGWEQINHLSELGHFPSKIPPDARFGGAWRGVATGREGREETSYLYLAQDGRVGVLSTFRP